MDKDLKGAKLKVEAYHPKYPTNIGQINQNVTNIKYIVFLKDIH